MIIRQFYARHGRSSLQTARKPLLIRRATNLSHLPPEAQQNPHRAYAAFADRKYDVRAGQPDSQWDSLQHDPSADVHFLLEREHRESRQSARGVNSVRSAKKSAVGDYFRAMRESRRLKALGSIQTEPEYLPDTHLKRPLSASNISLPKLLASQTHLGHATSLWHPGNSSYIFGIRDGIHIISLETTLAYLRRACRVVTEVARQGGLILFVGTRPGFRDIVVKAAKMSGGYHIFDRWTPGSLTNGQQILGRCRMKVVDGMDKEIEKFADRLEDYPVARPDLVVCLNPLENEVCLHECGLYNVPTIGIIDTDANSSWVTYPIPANDDSLRSVTLLTMALGKAGQEGQKMRLELAKKGKLTYRPTEFGDLLDEAEDAKSAQDAEEEGEAEEDMELEDVDELANQAELTDERLLTEASDQGESARPESAEGTGAGDNASDLPKSTEGETRR